MMRLYLEHIQLTSEGSGSRSIFKNKRCIISIRKAQPVPIISQERWEVIQNITFSSYYGRDEVGCVSLFVFAQEN